jgi:hypothetical protein
MKSKVYSVLAKVFFVLAAIQAAWLLLIGFLSLLEPAITSSPGTVTIVEPGNKAVEFIWQITPYLFLVISAGLGFYLRRLSRTSHL